MEETTVTVVATKRYALDPYVKIIQSRSNDIDVSFSSYIKPDNNNEQQKQQEDTELSIFEARSYFSESGGNDSDPRFSSVSSPKVSSFQVQPLLAWQSNLYWLWNERNSRLHTNSFRSIDSLFRIIDRQIRNRIQSFRSSNPKLASSMLQSWFRHA